MSTQSCTFKQTSYADGSGDGQSIYGVTDDYQAKVAGHAEAIGPFQRSAKAKAAAGDSIIWGGSKPYSGRVRIPWSVRGTLTTQTQSAGPLGQTKAEAKVRVTVALTDQTAGSTDSEVVIDITSSGQATKAVDESSVDEGKKDIFDTTFLPGHKYITYIQIEIEAHAEGQIKAPVLGADSLPDFFSDGFGAKLDSVTWELDLPDGVTLLCNVQQSLNDSLGEGRDG